MTTDEIYGDLIARILCTGQRLQTRNSVCRRVFAEKIVFESTPLVSVRKTSWKNSLREWEWFMNGSNRLVDLHPAVRPWWKSWTDEAGDISNNYSVQFRSTYGMDEYQEPVDQIALLIEGIREHPNSRRNVVTTWNAADMVHPSTKLTNCHNTVTQAFVDDHNALHLVTYQRSADVICGVPHNWLQMWAFLQWLAYRGDRSVGTLIWIGGDVHVYEKHDQLAAKIVAYVEDAVVAPVLVYTPTSDDFRADDFTLSGPYEPVLLDRAEMIV